MKLPFLACALFAITRVLSAADATFIELPFRYVIGGHSGGKWLSSEQAGKGIKPGTEFRICTLAGEKGKLTVSKAAPEADVCPDVFLANVSPDQDETKGIAINATWNPMPRAVKSESLTEASSVEAVRNLLAIKGIKKPNVKIRQHLRVDLDGDGQEEVIITATHYAKAEGEGSAPMELAAGDYSMVLLVRTKADKKITQTLVGETYPKVREDVTPYVHDVGGVLDVDGDGSLEILLHSQYYEGGGTAVWKLGKDKAAKVLEVECGV